MCRLLILLVALALPAVSAAQYGHPLKGSWSGDRTDAGRSIRLLIDLDWDGTDITGVINPGPNAATITKVIVDSATPAAWAVRLEATRTDATGTAQPIVVEGTLRNIGVPGRLFAGTWTEGGASGPFSLKRN